MSPSICFDLACHFFGEPNRKLSTALKPRWNSRGSFCVHIENDAFTDFETGISGGYLDLIQAELSCERTEASSFLKGFNAAAHNQHRVTRAAGEKTAANKQAGISKRKQAVEIWRESRPILGSLAETHLSGRSLSLLPGSDVLRFHPTCPFGPGERQPAMIAAFRDIQTDEIKAIHRTALNADGTKLDRKMLGSPAGCAIKLSADYEIEMGLVLAEGIETGLAAMQLGYSPVWVLGSAGAIAKFPVRTGIECLTICSDGDEASAKAITACADRWRHEAEVLKLEVGHE